MQPKRFRYTVLREPRKMVPILETAFIWTLRKIVQDKRFSVQFPMSLEDSLHVMIVFNTDSCVFPCCTCSRWFHFPYVDGDYAPKGERQLQAEIGTQALVPLRMHPVFCANVLEHNRRNVLLACVLFCVTRHAGGIVNCSRKKACSLEDQICRHSIAFASAFVSLRWFAFVRIENSDTLPVLNHCHMQFLAAFLFGGVPWPYAKYRTMVSLSPQAICR